MRKISTAGGDEFKIWEADELVGICYAGEVSAIKMACSDFTIECLYEMLRSWREIEWDWTLENPNINSLDAMDRMRFVMDKAEEIMNYIERRIKDSGA